MPDIELNKPVTIWKGNLGISRRNPGTVTSSVATLLLCIVLLAAICVTCSRSSVAQTNTDEAVPLRKDVDALVRVKYTRLPEEAFAAVTTNALSEWDEPRRLVYWIHAGQWDQVAALLQQFEPEVGRRLHAKICSDLLYARPPALLLPDDALALADASPVELDNSQINHVGGLLRIAVRETESRAHVMEILQRGTRRLGGTDELRRRITGQVLVQAQLHAESQLFGVSPSDLPAVADDRPATGMRPWAELLQSFAETETASDRELLLLDIHRTLIAATPEQGDAYLRMLTSDPARQDAAVAVLAMIGQSTARSSREVDMEDRALHIGLQFRAMQAVTTAAVDIADPWQRFAPLFAGNWLAEARNSFAKYPSWIRTPPDRQAVHAHVPVEHLIECAPSDAWFAAAGPQAETFMRILLSRLVLFSDNIDRALPHIQALQSLDSTNASLLANEYLQRWTQQHDPNLTEEIRREYKLEDQVIVLTRAQQEASLRQLGGLLKSLAPETRSSLDVAQLAKAFDYCHSRAEIHTLDHVTTVFGELKHLPVTLAQVLLMQMREKLAGQWRDLAVHKDAATYRTAQDICDVVNQGYQQAILVGQEWLSANEADWHIEAALGALHSDQAEFAYFQSVATDTQADRLKTYLEHTNQSRLHYRSAAQTYAGLLPTHSQKEFELTLYRDWFHSLLGITSASGINLRKGVTDDLLEELKSAIESLPGGAAAVHRQMFADSIAEDLATRRIAPQMKYRYLASAIQITGSLPTVYPAEEKIQYYDSLLSELRLQTRLDGSSRIHSPGDFGLFVSLLHTADIAREADGFSVYLKNQVQRTVSGRTVTEKPLYRDRFEESLRQTLGHFFDVRSIVFADPGAAPLAADAPPGAARRESGAWQETMLCYVLLGARDVTVDRVPSLEIELDFFDRDGKVVIPVPSSALPIALTSEKCEPRPASDLQVTQIVDARELASGRLSIDVSVTAHGLIPAVEDVLDLANYSLPVMEVLPQGTLQTKELRVTDDSVHIESEQSWTIQLDPAPLLAGVANKVTFAFPAAVSAGTEMVYLQYDDLDPVAAADRITLLEGDAAASVAQPDYRLWMASLSGVLLTAIASWLLLRRRPGSSNAEHTLAFAVPQELSPFAVITLLHRITTSPEVVFDEKQRQQLESDLRSLEASAFSRHGKPQDATAIAAMARRWADIANAACRSRNGEKMLQ